MAGEAPAQEREFAARPERGREASAARSEGRGGRGGRGGQGRGSQSSRGASAGRPVRRPAGRAEAEGEGRSPLHNPAAAALEALRAARPREDSLGAAGARPPPRLSRPRSAATGRGCGASGLRASSPALPPPRRRPGSLTFRVAPHHHARRRRLVRPRGPRRPRRRTAPSPGPGGGPRKESHRRAAPRHGPRSPHALGGRPCALRGGPRPFPSAGARAAAPPRPPPAGSLAPPPPHPLRAVAGSARAAGGRLAPPHPLAPPRVVRSGSRPAQGDPEPRELRPEAPLRPLQPSPAPPPVTPPAAGSALPPHVTVSLAGARGAWRAPAAASRSPLRAP